MEEEFLIANKYRLGPKIAVRCYIETYQGINVETNEEVLIKRVQENGVTVHPSLRREFTVTEILTTRVNVGIPTLRAFRDLEDYHYLVTSLVGPSLEELFKTCNRKFSLKTVLMLAFQMIDRVEFIHARFFLHRDICPANFLMGVGKDENRVYVSGFGLSKPFRDRSSLSHIPFSGYRPIVGTEIYGSIFTLSRFEQSRRDDLESLGYVLMEFLRGRLPWQGIKAENKKEKLEKICEKKVSVEALCDGYPPEFASYFHYCRSLRFDEKPNYRYLKRIFRDLFIHEGFLYDYAFDWKIKQSPRAEPEDGGDAGVACSSKVVNEMEDHIRSEVTSWFCSGPSRSYSETREIAKRPEGFLSEAAALESAFEQLNFKSL